MGNHLWGRYCAGIAVTTLLPITGPYAALADTRAYTKIVDLNTPIPGGTGNFTSLTHPQVSLGDIVFGGNGAAGQRGIYRFNPATSALATIVDGNSALPVSPATGALPPTLNNGGFALYGPDVSFPAVYGFNSKLITTRGGLQIAADENDAPSTAGPRTPISMDADAYLISTTLPKNFIPFGFSVDTFVSVHDNGVVNFGPTQENVTKYLARGGAASYATFARIGGASGTTGPFLLQSSAGSFQFSDGGASGLQPPSFFLPGVSSGLTLTGPSGPVFSDDGHTVVLRAVASPTANPADYVRTALLAQSNGGPLHTVVDTDTIVPTLDGVTKFAGFSNVTIDGNLIAFIGSPASGPDGIFAAEGGTLAEIISIGDTLDGKTVNALSFSGDRPLSGDDLVFTAGFTDGSTGLYLASVPEPGAGALLFVGIAMLTRRRGCR